MNYQSINPYTTEKIFEISDHSDDQILESIEKVDASFHLYKKTTFEERRMVLQRIIDKLSEQKTSLAILITTEMGKPISQSILEIEKCISVCRYYQSEGERLLSPIQYKSQFSKSFVSHEPLGVVLAIMPWNFPFWQVFRFLAPALMSGNTCILKHAPNVPQCALAIANIILESHEAPLLQNLFVSNEQVSKIISHQSVKAITLTGSETAGSAVASLAGKHIKKTVLELGGSDPFIVLEDADINTTIQGLIAGRFLNSGQSCIAAKRLYIHQGIEHDFMKRLNMELDKLVVGNPMDDKTFIGPIARKDLLEKLQEQVRTSNGEIYKFGKLPSSGFFHLPTYLQNIPVQSRINQEELFGPVLNVKTFTNTENCIESVNDTPFGLGASIWTHNLDNALQLAKSIDSGAVFINDYVKSSPKIPFGGIKTSGYGRELSDLGIKEFVNQKTIVVR